MTWRAEVEQPNLKSVGKSFLEITWVSGIDTVENGSTPFMSLLIVSTSGKATPFRQFIRKVLDVVLGVVRDETSTFALKIWCSLSNELKWNDGGFNDALVMGRMQFTRAIMCLFSCMCVFVMCKWEERILQDLLCGMSIWRNQASIYIGNPIFFYPPVK